MHPLLRIRSLLPLTTSVATSIILATACGQGGDTATGSSGAGGDGEQTTTDGSTAASGGTSASSGLAVTTTTSSASGAGGHGGVGQGGSGQSVGGGGASSSQASSSSSSKASSSSNAASTSGAGGTGGAASSSAGTGGAASSSAGAGGGLCGDNIAEGSEVCDGTDLKQKTCADVGFKDSPGLACDATCNAFDTTGCMAMCGNNVKEPGEDCDGSSPFVDQTCTANCTLQQSALVINEVVYDPVGADAACYIEIFGPPNTDLTGYSLAFWNAATPPVAYTAAMSLTGFSTGSNGYFVIVQDATASALVDPGANKTTNTKANMQNGPDSVQLLKGTVVVDALGYEATSAPTATFLGEGTPATLTANNVKSLSRLPNGADTNNNAVDFAAGTQTPGKANTP